MTSNDMKFVGVQQVVAHPLIFKHKLAIGEEAFVSMRVKKHLGQAWDVIGAAGTAGAAAKSSVVANAFFGKAGLMALMGGASTPLGWVIAASVVGGGAWFALTRVLRADTGERVDIIPKFINTPLDILAIRLFELMVPLALKVAAVDGQINNNCRHVIHNYMVGEWGYDAHFVEHALPVLEQSLASTEVEQIAQQLAYFEKQNPDCNYQTMSHDLVAFLHTVAQTDGNISAAQKMVIEQVQVVFQRVAQDNVLHKGLDNLKTVAESLVTGAGTTATQAAGQVEKVGKVVESAAGTAKDIGADLGKRMLDLVNNRRPHD